MALLRWCRSLWYRSHACSVGVRKEGRGKKRVEETSPLYEPLIRFGVNWYWPARDLFHLGFASQGIPRKKERSTTFPAAGCRYLKNAITRVQMSAITSFRGIFLGGVFDFELAISNYFQLILRSKLTVN